MEIQSLRLLIREAISFVLNESEQPGYVVRWSDYHNFFFLYKRVLGKDEQGDEIEQLQYVRGLGSDRRAAEKMAMELTGQYIPCIKPRTNAKAPKPHYRANTVMPVGPYKGKKYSEIPVDYLIQFIMNRKWMEMIRAESYVEILYEYLTTELLSQTKEYLRKFIGSLSNQELIRRHKNYTKTGMPRHYEAIAFRKMMLPMIEDTLQQRGVQFDTSTGEYKVIPSERS